MTAPSLSDTLRELARRLPERFHLDWNTQDPEDIWLVCISVKVNGGQKQVYWGGDTPQFTAVPYLEYALREEIEARGWRWVTQRLIGDSDPARGCKALVYRPGIVTKWGPREFVEAEAPTPAHALALALLAASGGEA